MSQAEHDCRIEYIELSVTDVAQAKRFYGQVFGWKLEDWGPDYASFHDGRLGGGFRQAASPPGTARPAPRGPPHRWRIPRLMAAPPPRRPGLRRTPVASPPPPPLPAATSAATR